MPAVTEPESQSSAALQSELAAGSGSGAAAEAPPRASAPVFARWQQEAEKHWQAGDYAWMAERVPAVRVLEVGCGAGFGTLALAPRASALMVIEPDADCIESAVARQHEASLSRGMSGRALPTFLQAGASAMDAAVRQRIEAFAPQWIVCWLMGGDDTALDKSLPPAQAVQIYRETVHRQVGELAASLPSVEAVHLVDRSAFPWKIKDTARETLVLYHQATTFAGLPFRIDRDDTLYRKLETRAWPLPASRPGQAPAGVVPVLGSLVARRVAPSVIQP